MVINLSILMNRFLRIVFPVECIFADAWGVGLVDGFLTFLLRFKRTSIMFADPSTARVDGFNGFAFCLVAPAERPVDSRLIVFFQLVG